MSLNIASASIATVVALAGGVASAQTVPLSYNWNGAAHQGEQGMPDAADGYRSISDRGWLLGGANSLGGTSYTVSLNGGTRVYEIPSSANVPDVVFIGQRDQNGGSWDGAADGDNVGVAPSWDPSAGTLAVASSTSSFAPIPLTADDALGFLFTASNGGGDFSVTLGFSDGSSVTVALNAPDWFANNNPGAGEQKSGVASQAAVVGPLSGGDGFEGSENVDSADAGQPLNCVEVNISQDSLLAELGFDWSGKSLNSLTFTSPIPADNTRVAIIAASIFDESAVEVTEVTLPRIGIMEGPEVTLPTREPNLVDSNGLDFFGFEPLGPGQFPNVAVVGLWEVAVATTPVNEGGLGQSTYTLDGPDSEYIMAKSIKSGPAPFYWTTGASNEGDLDINIGANPDVLNRQGGQFALPLGTSWRQAGAFGPANRSPLDAFSANGFQFENLGNAGPDVGLAEPNYAWSVGLEGGVALFSPAQNAVQNGQVDSLAGALPTLYGTTGTSFGGRRGKGYSIVDGFIAGIGGGETSARTTIYAPFGAAGLVQEFAFDTSCFYFPFADGWVGGTIRNNEEWLTQDSGNVIARSPILGFNGQGVGNGDASFDDASNVVTQLTADRMHVEIELPGARNPDNGMIFATASRGNNRAIINVLERDGKWELLGHGDENIDGNLPDDPTVNDGSQPENWATFGDVLFVYMDFDQPGLVGGKIEADGSTMASKNSGGFTVSKVGVGQYDITIAGEGGAENGAILLQGLDALPANMNLPGRTFFTYEYMNGAYRVEARRGEFDEIGGDANLESFNLVDAPFYFAYASFQSSLEASVADFNGDANLSAADDLVPGFEAIGQGWLELDDDGKVNFFDASKLVREYEAGL